MATITRRAAIMPGPDGDAIVEFDYDNVALRLVTVRVINPTSQAVSATVTKVANARTYTQTFTAGQTTSLAIPSSPAAARLGITIDARGRIDGAELALAWVLP